MVEKIVSKIADTIKPSQIILFGSRVKGTALPDSDVDLLLIYDGHRDKREVKLQIRHLFPNPDFSMDIIVLSPGEYERQKKLSQQ